MGRSRSHVTGICPAVTAVTDGHAPPPHNARMRSSFEGRDSEGSRHVASAGMPGQGRRVLPDGAAKLQSEEPPSAEADGALLALAVADRAPHRADLARTRRPLTAETAR